MMHVSALQGVYLYAYEVFHSGKMPEYPGGSTMATIRLKLDATPWEAQAKHAKPVNLF